MVKYQFYPTLLNEFQRFLNNPTDEQKIQLLKRINRIPETDPNVLAKFQKGVSFEEAVLKDKPHSFSEVIVQEARNWLPKRLKTQQLVQFIYRNIRFYGYADVVGEGRVIDIKTTAKHQPHRHDANFQNLYLYGLKEAGFTKMEYLIYDFQELHIETYRLEEYDFQPLLLKMIDFSEFIENNKNLISDKKIIVETHQGGLFG